MNTQSKHKLFEIFGWYGFITILTAYALTTFEVLPPSHLAIIALNGTGALGVAIEAYNEKAFPPAVLNTVWCVIAIIALFR